MCLAVIVVSLSLERQFVGEWSSLGVACLWSMVLYFPDPFLILFCSFVIFVYCQMVLGWGVVNQHFCISVIIAIIQY